MTNISESTDDDNSESFSISVLIPVGICIALLIISSVVGNTLTIIAFFRDRQLRTVYNMYITNLAVTDLLLGAVSMTFYAVYTLGTHTWPFGYHFCKIYMVMDFTLCMESILMMIIISWDRFLLLHHGHLYSQKETKNIALVKIIISWVISFLVYSPSIIGWDLWTGEDTNEPEDCDVQFAYDYIFTTTTAVIEFVIPFLSISALNVAIYWQIRKRTSTVMPINGATSSDTAASTSKRDRRLAFKPYIADQKSSASGVAKETSEELKLRKSVSKTTKAAKFLAALVMVFAVTWAPYTITTIIISFCDCVNKDFYEFLNWLLWSKASINPFLYAANSSRFLHNYKKMLWCFKCFYPRDGDTSVMLTTASTNANAM